MGRGSSSKGLHLWLNKHVGLIVSIVGGTIVMALVFQHKGLLLAFRKRRALPSRENDRIVRHLNVDHKDAVLLYAKHYGRVTLANAATIVSIDHDGMDLSVTVSSDSKPRSIRVDFDKPLKDAKDARAVLASMATIASSALGIPIKSEEEALLSLNSLTDTTYGFLREEMNKKILVGSVKKYNTHLFVVWKKATEWPKNIEDGEEETLPKVMAKALSMYKKNIEGKVKLNVTEPAEGDEEGTLLVYPQELCIKGLTIGNAESIIKALLVDGSVEDIAAVPGVKVIEDVPKKSLFVCSHLKRDKRCGLVGPYLVNEMQALVKEKGLNCPVRACSHVGGHTYAGNVLSFTRRDDHGRVIGDWFGYVSPLVAKDIIERHVMKGEILMSVWRGQMGLSEEEQEIYAKQACENCQFARTDL